MEVKMSKNRFQRDEKQRRFSFPWYFLNNEITEASKICWQPM